MAKSIIQSSKNCYITGRTTGLHKHHIFNGNGLREFSERNGLWIYLSWDIHRNLHDSSKLAIELKRIGQYYYEKFHSHDQFMEKVRKNYLTAPLSDEEKKKYKIDVKEYRIEEDDIESLLKGNFKHYKKEL